MRKIVVVAIVAALGLAGVVMYKRSGAADPLAADAAPAPPVRPCRWSSRR
jgi:hypothetical protein